MWLETIWEDEYAKEAQVQGQSPGGPGPLGRAPGACTEQLPGPNQALPSATESCRAELEDKGRRDQKDFLLQAPGSSRKLQKPFEAHFFSGMCEKETECLWGSQEEQEKALDQAPWSYTPEKQLIKGMISSLGSVPLRKRVTAPTCLRTNISGQLQTQTWALLQRCTLLLYHTSFLGETQFLQT